MDDRVGRIVDIVVDLFGTRPSYSYTMQREFLHLHVPDNTANRELLEAALSQAGITNVIFRKASHIKEIEQMASLKVIDGGKSGKSVELTWADKVKIADEVLREYRRITQPGKRFAMTLWNIRKALKDVMVCEKCGLPMSFIDEQEAMGDSFEIYRCKNDHQKVLNTTPPPPKCEICGNTRPIIDADESGPQYGQCRNVDCHAQIADVWNPAPDVYRG